MMKLKTMAVNTLPVAIKALTNWSHDQSATVHFVRASANFVWTFRLEGEQYFLRLTHWEERSSVLVEAELEYVSWLAEKGFRVARPVPSLKGKLVEEVFHESGPYSAVVFTRARGLNPDLEELSPQELSSWGRALGQLHNYSQSYDPTGPVRWGWQDQLDWVEGVLNELGEEAVVRLELAQVRQWLAELGQNPGDYGLVHYDFETDNLFWSKDTGDITVIDFDDSVYHWYVMDIVAALRDLDKLDPQQAALDFSAFVAGYKSVRPVNEELMAKRHLFRRAHTLLLYARVARSVADPFPDEPRWAQELRPRLEHLCADIRRKMAEAWPTGE